MSEIEESLALAERGNALKEDESSGTGKGIQEREGSGGF